MNTWIIISFASLCILFPGDCSAADAGTHTDDPGDHSALVKLNAAIKSPDASGAARCAAIFRLFANHLEVPSTAAELAQIFLEPSWIDGANIRVLAAAPAGVPMQPVYGETLYVVHLFPVHGGSSACTIYLTLTGAPLHKSDLIGLMKGKPNKLPGISSWRAIGISEFGLCGPDGICRHFPSLPTPITQDQAQQIGVEFAVRHKINTENYQPPEGRWADPLRRIWQTCFNLKEALRLGTDMVFPGDWFCVDVPVNSGRASFSRWKLEEVTWKDLLGEYQGETNYSTGPLAGSHCWLRLSQKNSEVGSFAMTCGNSGEPAAGLEFMDGTFTMRNQELVLHGVRRYLGEGEWGEENSRVIDQTPQQLQLRIHNGEAAIELRANFSPDMTFEKTH